LSSVGLDFQSRWGGEDPSPRTRSTLNYFMERSMPDRRPRATKEFAIFADASSIISSPNINAPV
jgi:hypothetical protein